LDAFFFFIIRISSRKAWNSKKKRDDEWRINEKHLLLCIRLERPEAFRITGVDDSAKIGIESSVY
jgi:hypothetical protein